MFPVVIGIFIGASIGGLIGYAYMEPKEKQRVDRLTEAWLRKKGNLPSSTEEAKEVARNLSPAEQEELKRYIDDNLNKS